MKKIIISVIFSLMLLPCLFAQGGPGGVGTSSNNIFWIDANQMGLSNDDPVSAWSDLSGNSNNLSQGTVGNQPVYKTSQVNGFPAVRFDGTDDYLDFGTHISTSATTFFIVYNKTTTTENGVFTIQHHLLKDKNNKPYLSSESPFKSHFVTKPINSFSVLTGRTDASASGSRYMITDGFSFSNTIRNSLVNRGSSVLGAEYTSVATIGSYFTGDISELIIYNEDLSDAERTIVIEMLSAKYNLASYAGLYSYTATHSNSVKGIGMESDGSNTSAQGSDSLEISTASDLENSEYLLTGNDGGAYTTSLSTPITIAERWEKIWRVDETGDVGTVTLEFKLGSNGFASVSNYALIIENNDGDFSNGDVVTHTTGRSYSVGANSISFTGVDLADGDYFTLAEINSGITSISSGTWKTPSTWSCTCIPAGSDVVTIQNPHVVTIDSNVTVLNLTLSSGGSLTFSGSDSLKVFDELDIQSSSFTAGSGTVSALKSSGVQSFSNTSFSNITFNNLYVNNLNGLTLASGGWSISGSLQVSAGGLDVSSADSIVLLSDASSTSQILESMNSAFTGEFIIQRYIDTRNAGFGNMSSPISDATFNDLDDDLFLSGIGGINGNANTGSGGVFYSIFSYDPFLDAHDTIKDVNASMAPSFGYEVYLATTFSSLSATTIDFRGSPTNGDVRTPEANQVNKNWNLLGNPYHSHIDWDQSRAGFPISESYYVFNTDNGTYDFETGGSKRAIAPGQGFWVFNTLGGGIYVTFEESDKVVSTSSTYYRNKRQTSYPEFTLSSKVNNYQHSMHLNFDIFATENIDEFDTPELPSPLKEAPAITSRAKNSEEKLIFNTLNPLESSQIIPISVYAGVEGNHEISANNIDLLANNYSCIYLKDKVQNKTIDLLVDPVYNFDSQKGNSDRFELILSNDFNECDHIIENESFTQNLDRNLELRNSYNQWFLDYTLEEDLSKVEVRLFNLNGQEVLNPRNFSLSGSGSQPLGQLNNLKGVYLLQIRNKDEVLNKTIKL
ncbi:MAG: T9SS type A sorting domain-containing protein [Flavobacteriales bacterium]|nr:T9SS type A sorting domain-containing protein [Flavobacteriales bacterium]